jgi:hypothetical protein
MNLLGALDGEGRWALGGVGRELIHRAHAMGGATDASTDPQFGSILGQDPEVLKILLTEMAVESGLNLLFHSMVVDVEVHDGAVASVVVANKAGLHRLTASVIVDATSDADVVAKAGGEFVIGRHEDGKMQPASRIFRVGDVDMKRVFDYLAENPQDLKPPTGWTGGDFDVEVLRNTPGATLEGFGDLIRTARAAGDWDLPRWRLGLYTLPGRSEVGVNVTRIHGIDGTDPVAVTRAEVATTLQMAQVLRFLRSYVPGFESAYIVSAPHQVGIRETRHIRGGYVLSQRDVMDGRSFDDQIGRGAYPLDVHDVENGKGLSQLWPIPRSYGIPLRCLLPVGLQNVVVAGRPISASHEAAGTAAALAASERMPPARLEYATLQSTLEAQGALLRRAESEAAAAG